MYEKGSQVPYKNISLEIRPKFLEWVVMNKSIYAGRDLFNQLKDLEPPCRTLYMTMIAFEKSQLSIKKLTIRKLYNEACNKFGEGEIGYLLSILKKQNAEI